MKSFDLARGLGKILWLANLLFALCLALGLWLSREQHLRYASERADNTVLALSSTVAGKLDQIALLLAAVADELEHPAGPGQRPDHAHVNDSLERLVTQVPGLSVVRFSDAGGQVEAGDGLPRQSPAVSIAERDYFKRLREQRGPAMVSSQPVFGQTNGRQVLVFARRYDDAAGQFARVVYASVELSRFTALFAELKLGERANVGLVSEDDFLLLARYPAPADPSLIGRRLQQQFVIDQMKAGGGAVSLVAGSPSDQVQRLYAMRKLPGHPYWLAVGLSTADELLPWRREVELALFVMLIFAGLTGAAGWQLRRGWRHQLQTLATLQSTLEATDNGILVLDQDRRMLHANQRFRQMWNLPETTVRSGAADAALLAAVMDQLSDPALFLHDVEQAYGCQQGSSPLATLKFKDGRTFERSSQAMLVNGAAAGLVWSFRDVSDRVRRERELAGYRSHLELMVEARTHELAIAKDLAESSNRAKSTFLANMSHELRTPLNAILGFAQLMEFEPEMSAQCLRRLAVINSAGRHLLSLITDVLELSRIEAGRSLIQGEPFDLTALLRGAEARAREQAEAKGLDFEFDPADDLPTLVMGDGPHLDQVLDKLLANAVKYTPQGRVSLRVRRDREGEREIVVFEITDTGPGIAPADQARVFEAFYQTDLGLAKGEGAGLGLTISQEYARLMGGSLSLQSEPSQGCLFTLRLPLPALAENALPPGVAAGIQP